MFCINKHKEDKLHAQCEVKMARCERSFLLQIKKAVLAHLYNVRVGSALVGLVVLCVFQQHFVHVCAGVLEQFVRAVENDEGDLTVT